jgi:iron complex transport system substrate-binding protein
VNPQRVVCVDPGFSWQTLLEVGLTPVGVPMIIDTLVSPENVQKVQGVTSAVDADGNPDVEQIAALRPDLILASTGAAIDSVYDRLSQIAPTAVFAFDFPSDWITLDHAYADAVNRADQLAAVSKTYTDRAAEIKATYSSVIAAQKWALITSSSDQIYVWGSRSSAGPVLAEAGAAFSSGAPDASSPFLQLSLERLDTLSDATVILYGAGSDGKPYADTAALLENPVFNQLPAVQAGHVYPLPSWFAYCYQDALAQLEGIEAVCKQLQS